jgi:hypothetical protein
MRLLVHRKSAFAASDRCFARRPESESPRVLCNALEVNEGYDIRIARFDHSMQDAFRLLVLDGMAERWGSVDNALNADLDDIDTHYRNDCVLVALEGGQI